MKTLVAYFSASGVTRRKGQAFAKSLNADIYEIIPKDLYTDADLNWMDKKSRSTLEMQDPACRPQLKEKTTDLSAYDTVYIGFPIWWGVAPRVINTFIENNDLSGKRIVIFATSGGSGVGPAVKDLQKTYPNLQIETGRLL
ncbi:MAG: NAD(P)H-dependent oxidoreductase [Eubacterium sp.]|nr:NAD(P)H-dependent oxidoreductase [Eubacterium sp.]